MQMLKTDMGLLKMHTNKGSGVGKLFSMRKTTGERENTCEMHESVDTVTLIVTLPPLKFNLYLLF